MTLFAQDELEEFVAELENFQSNLPNLPNTPLPSKYKKFYTCRDYIKLNTESISTKLKTYGLVDLIS